MSLSKKDRLDYLLKQYASGLASDQEVMELSDFLKTNQYEPEVKTALEVLSYEALPSATYDTKEVDAMIDRILQWAPREARVIPMRRSLFPRIAAAAVLLILLGGGAWLFVNHKTKAPVGTQAQRFKNDVPPGHSGAVLTLADGTKINLDSAANGKVMRQGKVSILNKNNELLYKEQGKENEVAYNTLATTRGQTYATVLADGSKVWLNSASSIRFPVAFAGKQRSVEITGEAYFEVAHDATRPFHVMANGAEIQVLGTHFNVNAYSDEETLKATLLEGSIEISKGGLTKMITPGEQAQVGNVSIEVTEHADIDEVMAWKNGKFSFNNADMRFIMRQVTRWYDVDVDFEGETGRHFVADIPRDLPVSKLLHLLELTDRVHFKVEGRKITVMP